jgi:hypothetical protein
MQSERDLPQPVNASAQESHYSVDKSMTGLMRISTTISAKAADVIFIHGLAGAHHLQLHLIKETNRHNEGFSPFSPARRSRN